MAVNWSMASWKSRYINIKKRLFISLNPKLGKKGYIINIYKFVQKIKSNIERNSVWGYDVRRHSIVISLAI